MHITRNPVMRGCSAAQFGNFPTPPIVGGVLRVSTPPTPNTAARRSIPGSMRCNPKTSIRRPTSKARGIPLAVYSCEYTPCFAAARVAVGRGPYFVSVLRILRPANSLQKSPPSISFQNPPPRQLSVLNSLLCVQPSPSGFRAEFFTVCTA